MEQILLNEIIFVVLVLSVFSMLPFSSSISALIKELACSLLSLLFGENSKLKVLTMIYILFQSYQLIILISFYEKRDFLLHIYLKLNFI